MLSPIGDLFGGAFAPPQTAPKPSGRRRRILLAQPSLGLSRLLKATLGDDFDYWDVASGDELAAALRQANPDLVMIDLALPGPDVLNLCASMQDGRANGRLSVVLLSSTPLASELAQVAGIDATILKPFRPLELLDTIYGLVGDEVRRIRHLR